MKSKSLFSNSSREAEEQEKQQSFSARANMEILKQELSGYEEEAAVYFRDFKAPEWKKPRHWLLPTETIGDLRPECVDCVLKYLNWFKAQIRKLVNDPNWDPETHDGLPMNY